MFELSIFSIFRQSESYLDRYLKQVFTTFLQNGGKCHAIWLEGDSSDQTYAKLSEAKAKFESVGHAVTLIKYDLNGPHWPAINHSNRWLQLSTCWNKCLGSLQPTKIGICVESDLIWDPRVVPELIAKIDDTHHVLYPMLMDDIIEGSSEEETFMDIWGFSRGGKKFSKTAPYWPDDEKLTEEDDLLQIETGGGMIVTTYPHLVNAKWDDSCCILKFSEGTNLFMDRTLKIYHPRPIRKSLLQKVRMSLSNPSLLYAKLFK